MQYKTAVAVSRNDASSIFSLIRTVDSSSKDVSVYWSELIGFWRDMLVYKYLSEEEKNSYLDLTEPELRLLADASRRFRKETLTYHFSLLDEAHREMARLPQTKRLTAELTLLKMADPSLEMSQEALLTRIAALEEKIILLESQPAAFQAPVPAPADIPSSEEIVDETTDAAEHSADSSTSTAIPAPPAEDEWKPVLELGDVIDRIAAQNPLCSSFLGECECYVRDNGLKILIKTVNDFGKTVLSSDASQQSLQTAFRMCGITSPGAVITIETGAVPKKKPAIDELQEF